MEKLGMFIDKINDCAHEVYDASLDRDAVLHRYETDVGKWSAIYIKNKEQLKCSRENEQLMIDNWNDFL